MGRNLRRVLPKGAWSLRAGAIALAAVLLAGCGGIDGIEINGKLADAVGISTRSQPANRNNPVVPERAALVLPPSTDALPAPGASQVAGVVVDQQWPDDPDKRLAMMKSEELRQLRDECANGKVGGDINDFEKMQQNKSARCGNLWTWMFNQGIEQGKNGTGAPAVMQNPELLKDPPAQ
mgnify:FL=1